MGLKDGDDGEGDRTVVNTEGEAKGGDVGRRKAGEAETGRGVEMDGGESVVGCGRESGDSIVEDAWDEIISS